MLVAPNPPPNDCVCVRVCVCVRCSAQCIEDVVAPNPPPNDCIHTYTYTCIYMYACANVGAYIRLFKVRLLKSLTFATLLLQDFNTLKSLKRLIHLRLYFAVKRLALYFVRSACALCLCSHISASLGTRTLLHMTQPLVTLPHHSAPPRSASLGTACIAGRIASWHITASTASLRA